MSEKPKHRIVETTDLRTRTRTYKIYQLTGTPSLSPPVAVGIATREEAEAMVQELEQAGAKP